MEAGLKSIVERSSPSRRLAEVVGDAASAILSGHSLNHWHCEIMDNFDTTKEQTDYLSNRCQKIIALIVTKFACSFDVRLLSEVIMYLQQLSFGGTLPLRCPE